MCFRPTEVSIAMSCPHCGKKINPVAGVMPTKCPFCESPGPFVAATPSAAAPGAPAAPDAPTAPGAPAAPAAPAAPGAPAVPEA